MTKLASYLRRSRHGVFYYRLAVVLRRGQIKTFCVSLGLRDPAKARTISYIVTNRLLHVRHLIGITIGANPTDEEGIELMLRRLNQLVRDSVRGLTNRGSSVPSTETIAQTERDLAVVNGGAAIPTQIDAPPALNASNAPLELISQSQVLAQALIAALQTISTSNTAASRDVPVPLVNWDDAIGPGRRSTPSAAWRTCWRARA